MSNRPKKPCFIKKKALFYRQTRRPFIHSETGPFECSYEKYALSAKNFAYSENGTALQKEYVTDALPN